MSKRRAEKQIKPNDSGDDDEIEDRGVFTTATEEDLAKRVMKKAKRRNPGSENSSPLVNFAGFSTAPTGSPFSFFNKISQNTEDTPQKASQPNSNSLSSKSCDRESLKALNLSCLKWIQQHLDKNPYVVLVPVFKDYEKHLATLTSTTSNNTGAINVGTTSAGGSSFPASTSTSLPSLSKPDVSSAKPATTNFSLGSPAAPAFKPFPAFNLPKTTQPESTSSPSSNIPNSPLFKFGSVSSSPLNNGTISADSIQSPVFSVASSVGSAAPFSFGLSNQPSQEPPKAEDSDPAKTTGNSEEPSDEPPNFDFVPVGEEGSVFDIRCKIFFKKDNNFVSAGVGTLYLKQVTGGKTQLITRADTAQGSVLLNLILSPDLPLQPTAKNNILLICVPTPDAKPPPVPVLIRVKNKEDRDKLLKEMERLRAS